MDYRKRNEMVIISSQIWEPLPDLWIPALDLGAPHD